MCIHKGLFIMTEKKKQQSFLSQPSPSMLSSHFLPPPLPAHAALATSRDGY